MDDAGRPGAGLCRAAGLVPASEIVLRERPVASEQAVSAQPRRVRSRHHADTVAELAACGRARWKIENETFNVLKTKRIQSRTQPWSKGRLGPGCGHFLRTVKIYSTIGRLQRWPPFAKGSLSSPAMEVTVVLAYEDLYRALAGDATIPGDRPVRPGSEKNRTSQGLPQQGGWRADS